MTKVSHLFIKSKSGVKPESVKKITVTTKGIQGHLECNQFRQVLILNKNTIKQFNLEPGSLSENIIINDPHLHSLPSGTVLKFNDVQVRLTFLCEPCYKIKQFVDPRKVLHQRGYLGLFLNSGTISIGNQVENLNKQYESIPYNILDRIKWALDQKEQPIFSTDLIKFIGLSKTYCRVMPHYLKKLGPKYQKQVLFKKDISSK